MKERRAFIRRNGSARAPPCLLRGRRKTEIEKERGVRKEAIYSRFRERPTEMLARAQRAEVRKEEGSGEYEANYERGRHLS